MTRALLLLSLLACAHPSGERWVSTELVFGLSRPDGGVVSEADWKAFVDESVTAAFPDGYSVLEARGHWRGDQGVSVSEDSRVLWVLHPRGAEADEKLDALRHTYAERFQQESVLRVDRVVYVSFE